jgi:hypothetical protein
VKVMSKYPTHLCHSPLHTHGSLLVEVVEKHNATLLGGAGMGLVKINCVSSKAWLAFIAHKVQWTWKMEQMVMWFTEVHLLHYTTHTHLSPVHNITKNRNPICPAWSSSRCRLAGIPLRNRLLFS